MYRLACTRICRFSRTHPSGPLPREQAIERPVPSTVHRHRHVRFGGLLAIAAPNGSSHARPAATRLLRSTRGESGVEANARARTHTHTHNRTRTFNRAHALNKAMHPRPCAGAAAAGAGGGQGRAAEEERRRGQVPADPVRQGGASHTLIYHDVNITLYHYINDIIEEGRRGQVPAHRVRQLGATPPRQSGPSAGWQDGGQAAGRPANRRLLFADRSMKAGSVFNDDCVKKGCMDGDRRV
jgi:hypothetical protein